VPFRRIGKKVYKVLPNGKLELKGESKSERLAEKYLAKLNMVTHGDKK